MAVSALSLDARKALPCLPVLCLASICGQYRWL